MTKKFNANRKTVQQTVNTQHRKNPTGKAHKKQKNKSTSARATVVELNNWATVNQRPQQYAENPAGGRDVEPFKAKNEAQQRFIDAISSNCLSFGLGPAGTGKSYCACAMAVKAYEAGRVDKILLTRPAVEAGEQLGFLPGDIDDKFAVYVEAFRDILAERLGPGRVDFCLREGHIQIAPLAYMRGKTFNDRTFVILEEAQNTSKAQMKMFLSRIGENCKVVVNGDVAQSDIGSHNGLADAITRLQNLDQVHLHQFEHQDIVRSGLVREIIQRYETR